MPINLSDKRKVWYCRIGVTESVTVPNGADAPMRAAVKRAFSEVTGREYDHCFSGWAYEWPEDELAVIENRLPKPTTNTEITALRAEVERLRAERAEAVDKSVELKKALSDLARSVPDEFECDNFHHSKPDNHRVDEACPPLRRYYAALAAARAALEEKK